MPRPPTEPLEDVLLRLETLYASDRNERDAKFYGNGSTEGTQSQPDGLNSCMLPCLAAVCLLPHNNPEDYAVLFRYFVDKSSTHASVPPATMVLRLRAALFKACILTGVVQVSNALEALFFAIKQHPKGPEILAALPKQSQKRARTAEQDAKAGWELFSAIYERHAQRIIDNIGLTSPDLAENIIDELYGANLSRTDILTWRETVLVEFTGCAILDCPAQAKGHFYGCKNLKVGKRNVYKAIEVVRAISRWQNMPIDESRMPFLASLDAWEF